MAEPSDARLCGRSLARIAGSNRTGGMDVCLLCVMCAWVSATDRSPVQRSPTDCSVSCVIYKAGE